MNVLSVIYPSYVSYKDPFSISKSSKSLLLCEFDGGTVLVGRIFKYLTTQYLFVINFKQLSIGISLAFCMIRFADFFVFSFYYVTN